MTLDFLATHARVIAFSSSGKEALWASKVGLQSKLGVQRVRVGVIHHWTRSMDVLQNRGLPVGNI